MFSFHISVEGGGFASVPGVAPIAYAEGDVLVFPHGDACRMQNAPGTAPELGFDETMAFMRALAEGALPFVAPEGGGGRPHTLTICGFPGCDAAPFDPILAGLPRLLRLRRPTGDGRDMLDGLIAMTVEEARVGCAGGRGVGVKLAELMFAEVLRRHVDAPGPRPVGWLAALSDARLARALAALHARPEHAWTVEALAREAGMSRSALGARFAQALGMPPLRYLGLWRMQLAAGMLAGGPLPVAEIGRRVGYASEQAFSRGFRRATGLSPARWRAARGAG